MKHPVIRYEKERKYPITRAEAWHLLADTDHLNRSIGLPAINFSPMDPAAGKLVRDAQARAFGAVPVRWKEYPFNWIRERQYVVRREFQGGPIAVLEGAIDLQPADGGDGTHVRVYADFVPANISGRVLWRLGAGTVDNMVGFCERYLARKAEGRADPTPLPAGEPAIDRARLDVAVADLRARPVDPELVMQLAERVREGSDDQLYRIRPYELADLWGADRHEVLRLCLHATQAGLLELRWELMCPTCRVPKAESAALDALPQRYHCDVCGIDYAVQFDERVELRFSVHPSIRRVDFNVYCIGGPLRTPHILAQQFLRGGEARRLDLEIAQPLRLRTVGGTQQLRLEPGGSRRWGSELSFTYAAGRWAGPHSLEQPDGSFAVPPTVALNLRNQMEGPLLAVLEDPRWDGAAATAAEVTLLSEFRELFESQELAPGVELVVKNAALLASELRSSAFSTDQVAERAAHLEFWRERSGTCRGAVVKVEGQLVVMGFSRLADARQAAAETPPDQTVRMGLAEGPVTAVRASAGIEYIGRNVELAADRARAAADAALEEGSAG